MMMMMMMMNRLRSDCGLHVTVYRTCREAVLLRISAAERVNAL